MIKLSIIILSYNTKELLKKCLESLVQSTEYRVQSEIVVVDNGSTDGSVEMLRKFKVQSFDGVYPEYNRGAQDKSSRFKVELIENKENLGFAKGNNIGIREAQGQYIMLLNSDTEVKAGAIETLIDFLDRDHPCQAAVSPLLLLPSGKPQTDYYMRFPNLWQIFLYHNPVLRPLVMKIPFLRPLIAQRSSQNPFEVEQLPGAALMALKDVWDKVGLLDEDYCFLFEDVDWCYRAKKLGIKLMVIPDSKIVHLGGGSWRQKAEKNSSEFYYQFFTSMFLFVKKNYNSIQTQIFMWAIALNFILTLKPLLAWRFIKNNGKQKNFLLQ